MTEYSKKAMKIVSALMVVMIIISTFSMVFADTTYDPSKWDSQPGGKIDDGGVKQWIGSIMNIVAIVGSGIAVIALIVLGIKYMMGSVEEKAEYKKTMMPYVIGALMVFGASAIVGFIAGAIK
ncbi:MAG: TrbC/VirB2 family protein [Clostridia bacterium]|nr:TrbC/VirB2 family protein [Clostridia bacterium]